MVRTSLIWVLFSCEGLYQLLQGCSQALEKPLSTNSIFSDHLGLGATWSPKEDPLEGVGGGVAQAGMGGHQPARREDGHCAGGQGRDIK